MEKVSKFMNYIENKHGKEMRKQFWRELKKWDYTASTQAFYDSDLLFMLLNHAKEKVNP